LELSAIHEQNMSKIYDALVKLEKRPQSRTAFSRSWRTNTANTLSLWKNISPEWKIVGALAGMMLVFGLLLIGIVNQLIVGALRNQIDQRASVMATNLSDAAAGHVIGRNVLELHALVTKYVRLEGSAYALIEDNKGQIIAHTLPTFPPELTETLNVDERRLLRRRVVRLRGKPVYEIRAPILEGQAGAARIGIWEESVATEINDALLPIVAVITSLLLAAVTLAIFLARGIIRWLSEMAGGMSMGDLTRGETQLTDGERTTSTFARRGV
jgi:sensor histidine kinase regulating citrate/malate metabolism